MPNSIGSTPVPDMGVQQDMQRQSMPSSPVFWGKKYVPPTPEQAAPRGPQPYPRMMYHPDGRMQVAHSEEDHIAALDNGWQDKPDLSHRELLQFGDGGKSGRRLSTAGSIEIPRDPTGRGSEKWGAAAIAASTEVTQRHVDFLVSRGYPIKKIADAKHFAEQLDVETAAQFFTEAAAWEPTVKSEE